MLASRSNPIILYDGICGLCNRFVQFVLRHDSHDRFRFAALQTDFAACILQQHGAAPADLDTMYVVLEHALPAERLAPDLTPRLWFCRNSAEGGVLSLWRCKCCLDGCGIGVTIS